MEGSSEYCILWNNYYTYLSSTLRELQQDGHLVDVTMVTADGNSIDAHRLVLSACSTFFRNILLKDKYTKHPIVLLPLEIKYAELKAMVEFMYTGQVCIQQDRLQDFIKGARYFRIKGLEDKAEDSDADDLESSELEKDKLDRNSSFKLKYDKGQMFEGDEPLSMPTTTVKGKIVKDHRYTQHVDLGDSDDNRDKWEVVDRKPVIFPRNKKSISGVRNRRKKFSSMCKVPVHLSNNIICYEHRTKMEDNAEEKDEPINKVRRPGYLLDICSCAARKIWSVKDTEALLNAWMETLNQVPPSYFIRSMNLCRRVAKKLQQMGVQKNWRQCQVKMKNLRREVRLYKESAGRNSQKKSSSVANACEKLLSSIEEIFNKEESIRREWYQKKGVDRLTEEAINNGAVESVDILAQVELGDSDMCDDDTDMPLMETEGEGDGGVMTETEGGGGFTEGEEEIDAFRDDREGPHHQMHTGPDGTVVHHIVEDISFHTIDKETHPQAL